MATTAKQVWKSAYGQYRREAKECWSYRPRRVNGRTVHDIVGPGHMTRYRGKDGAAAAQAELERTRSEWCLRMAAGAVRFGMMDRDLLRRAVPVFFGQVHARS